MAKRSGDIVAVLSLEDFEFTHGLSSARGSLSSFARDVKSTGQQASSDWGRAVGQMGFAAQDFTSVFSMGGKGALSRALMSTTNNVQMLGQSLGPWGMAIFSVGGALGSLLIPKLFEATDATEDFTKALEKNMEALNKLISKDVSGLGFSRKLGDLQEHGTGKEVDHAIKDEQGKIDDMELELGMRRKGLKRSILDVGLKRGITNQDVTKPVFGPNDELLQPNLGINADIVGHGAADIIEAEGQKIRDLEDSIKRARNRKGALVAAKPGIEKNEAIREADEAAAKQHDDDMKRIGDTLKHRTSFDRTGKLSDSLLDLVQIGARSPGNAHILSKGMDDLFAEFTHSLPKSAPTKLAGAAMLGSSDAVSAINRAAAGKTDPAKEELEEAKKLVDIAKRQLAQLEEANKKQKQIVPIKLGGP